MVELVPAEYKRLYPIYRVCFGPPCGCGGLSMEDKAFKDRLVHVMYVALYTMVVDVQISTKLRFKMDWVVGKMAMRHITESIQFDYIEPDVTLINNTLAAKSFLLSQNVPTKLNFDSK